MASNDIPYANDKLTLTGSSGELDKYESVMVSLMGAPNYRQLISAKKAEFDINANGSIEYTIIWLGGLVTETEIFDPGNLPETPPETPTFMLDVTTGIGGSVTGSGVYEQGTKVNVIATASEGYQFKNWNGSVAIPTSSSTTFIIPATNSTITANLELTPVLSAPSIAFTNNGNKYTIRVTGQSGATINLYLPNGIINTKKIPNNQTTVTFDSPLNGTYKAKQKLDNGQESDFSIIITK